MSTAKKIPTWGRKGYTPPYVARIVPDDMPLGEWIKSQREEEWPVGALGRMVRIVLPVYSTVGSLRASIVKNWHGASQSQWPNIGPGGYHALRFHLGIVLIRGQPIRPKPYAVRDDVRYGIDAAIFLREALRHLQKMAAETNASIARIQKTLDALEADGR